jgi:hypothetical protein
MMGHVVISPAHQSTGVSTSFRCLKCPGKVVSKQASRKMQKRRSGVARHQTTQAEPHDKRQKAKKRPAAAAERAGRPTPWPAQWTAMRAAGDAPAGAVAGGSRPASADSSSGSSDGSGDGARRQSGGDGAGTRVSWGATPPPSRGSGSSTAMDYGAQRALTVSSAASYVPRRVRPCGPQDVTHSRRRLLRFVLRTRVPPGTRTRWCGGRPTPCRSHACCALAASHGPAGVAAV